MSWAVYKKLLEGLMPLSADDGQKYWPILERVETLVNEVAISGSFSSVVIDKEHGLIYAGNEGEGGGIYTVSLRDLTSGGSSVEEGAPIKSMIMDSTHLYVGTAAGTISKRERKTLSLVGKSTQLFTGNISALAQDETFLYASEGGTGKKIFKIRKDDLSITASSAVISNGVYSIASDSDALYTASWTYVHRVSKDTLEVITTSSSVGSASCLICDDKFVYCNANSVRLRKLNKSSLSVAVGSSDFDYGVTIRGIAQDGSYLYVGGDSAKSNGIKQYRKSDLALEATMLVSANSGDINALSKHDHNLYIVGTLESLRQYYADVYRVIGYRRA